MKARMTRLTVLCALCMLATGCAEVTREQKGLIHDKDGSTYRHMHYTVHADVICNGSCLNTPK